MQKIVFAPRRKQRRTREDLTDVRVTKCCLPPGLRFQDNSKARNEVGI